MNTGIHIYFDCYATCSMLSSGHLCCTHMDSVMEPLGSGQFGMVSKATWQSPKGEVEVAVKMLKEGSKPSDRVRFLQEAAIMGQFKHYNIVELDGVVIAGEPVS